MTRKIEVEMDVYARRIAFRNLAQGKATAKDFVVAHGRDLQLIDLGCAQRVELGGKTYFVGFEDIVYDNQWPRQPQNTPGEEDPDIRDHVADISKAYLAFAVDKDENNEDNKQAAVIEIRDRSKLKKIISEMNDQEVECYVKALEEELQEYQQNMRHSAIKRVL